MANEQLKLDNLECVYKNAYELFIENGIENTTKVMLVRRSGLSLATINGYFSKKVDCVLQTAIWASKNVREASILQHERLSVGNPTGYVRLENYLDALKALFFNNPKLFVFFAECRIFVFRNSADYKRDAGILRQSLGSFKFIEDSVLQGLHARPPCS